MHTKAELPAKGVPAAQLVLTERCITGDIMSCAWAAVESGFCIPSLPLKLESGLTSHRDNPAHGQAGCERIGGQPTGSLSA